MSQYVESEKVELKAKYTDTICKEIVSFLNADGGQVIMLTIMAMLLVLIKLMIH